MKPVLSQSRKEKKERTRKRRKIKNKKRKERRKGKREGRREGNREGKIKVFSSIVLAYVPGSKTKKKKNEKDVLIKLMHFNS